jgi:hypothetical protein
VTDGHAASALRRKTGTEPADGRNPRGPGRGYGRRRRTVTAGRCIRREALRRDVTALLVSASPVQTLRVDGEAGNNTLNGVFDAPPGERITAVSSAVHCDIQIGPDGRNLSGRCSVSLTSITVDADPTKTEHFRQWATNRKADPARCMLEAQLEEIAVSLPQASGESIPFQAEVPFTVCGRAREDGGRERVSGTVVRLDDRFYRVRARVEHFHREAYRSAPGSPRAGWPGCSPWPRSSQRRVRSS